MLTTFSNAHKTWIYAQEGLSVDIPIARTVDFVINPKNGIFEAIWVMEQKGLKLINIKDILRWNTKEIFINNKNVILDSEKHPKLQSVLENELSIIGAPVFTNKKKFLGKVKNFVFDTISPRILSLIVKSGFLFFGKTRIIPKSRITKITTDGIFVSENTEKVTDKEKKEIVAKKKEVVSEYKNPSESSKKITKFFSNS